MSVLLTLNLVLWATLAYASVLFIIPACKTSTFRYRLWHLRDDLVDEIRAGRFEDSDLPKQLVADIELVIAGAKELNLRNFAIFHLVMRREARSKHEEFDLDSLSAHDRELLEEYLDQLNRTMIRHALTGSPSGWMFTVLVIPPLLLVAIVTRFFGTGRHGGRTVFEETKFHVKDEFDLEPALALVRQRQDRRSAYMHG